jgi:hypothetical protein
VESVTVPFAFAPAIVKFEFAAKTDALRVSLLPTLIIVADTLPYLHHYC